MSPIDQNILSVLNLLCVLLRINIQKIPKIPEVEQYILTVTKEHLISDNISLSALSNTLQILAEKGYLFSTTIHDPEYHDKIREAFSDEVYLPAMKTLEESGKNSLSEDQKLILGKALYELVPAHLKSEFSADEFVNEDITLSDLLDESRKAFVNHKDNVVSKVVIMPFRNIDRVRRQMNEGKSFVEVIDSDVWYNEEKYQFHIERDIVQTSYQDKPNIEHYILRLIPEHLEDGVIWYDEIEDKNSRSIKDALLKFVAKNKKLEDLFTVHTNRFEFDVEAFK